MKTDSQLQQDVLAELKWEPSVNAAAIGVEVNEGVVTLAGHVSSYTEKLDAERAVQRVPGVKALAIEMDVRLFGLGKRVDAEIALAAQNVLQWMSVLPKDAIKVMVENGWITLSGDVEWQYQKQAAAGAVRYLMGVSGVTDDIVIGPKVSLSAIESDIETALKRRAVNNAPIVSVTIQGDDVTLTGTVNTWAERDLAWHCAWGATGVRNVVDKITISN